MAAPDTSIARGEAGSGRRERGVRAQHADNIIGEIRCTLKQGYFKDFEAREAQMFEKQSTLLAVSSPGLQPSTYPLSFFLFIDYVEASKPGEFIF